MQFLTYRGGADRATRRMKAAEVRPGWNDLHVPGLIIGVLTVLPVNLLTGTGDYQAGHIHGGLFGLDATRHAVLSFDDMRRNTLVEQASPFFAAERVAGMDQRNAEQAGEPGAYVAGIGVMAMNDVRNAADAADMLQGLISHGIQMRPQYFLAQIAARPKGQAHDMGFGCDLLHWHGVVG